jgi:hypothetical protein
VVPFAPEYRLRDRKQRTSGCFSALSIFRRQEFPRQKSSSLAIFSLQITAKTARPKVFQWAPPQAIAVNSMVRSDSEQAKPAPDHDPGIAGGNTARVYNFDVTGLTGPA